MIDYFSPTSSIESKPVKRHIFRTIESVSEGRVMMKRVQLVRSCIIIPCELMDKNVKGNKK